MKIRILSSVFVLVLAAVAADAFAQAKTPTRGSLLNAGRTGSRPAVPAARASAAALPTRPAAVPPATSSAAKAGAASGAGAAEPAEGEAPPFAWDAAPVDIVLQAYGEQIDKTILKDPKVNAQATISLKSREGQKLTKEEYLEAIEVVLEMNDIHLEPYGEKFIRAIPRGKARKEGIPLYLDPERNLEEKGRVISMMIPFKNIGIEDAQKVFDNFKSDSSNIIALERTNSMLVTDTEQNIRRMVEIARTIDVATPVLENVFVRQIKYAAATDIQTILQKIVEDSLKEQEKNKGAQNAQNQLQRPTFQPRLLGRNQPQQPQPAANQSVLVSISDADRGMIRGKVLIVAEERVNKLVIITQKSNMDFFDRVIEELDKETTPDTVVKVYRLKYAEAEEVSDMINDLIGNAASSKGSSKGNQNQNAKKGGNSNLTRTTPGTSAKSVNQRSGEAKAGELSKDNTTVLADKRINGLVVMTDKELVPVLESIIESMDVKLSQVLIETVIIEVTLGDTLNTGMDWIQKGRSTTQVEAKTATGNPLYYMQRTTTYKNEETGEEKTTTSLLSDLVEGGYSHTTTTSGDTGTEGKQWTQTITDISSSIAGKSAQICHDDVANYWTAGTSTAIAGGQGGQIANEVASGITSNLLGSAFSFIFNSDELGIAGILQMAKTDSHTKYVASPIIMTLDNKEAVIEATAQKQFLTGWTANSSGYTGSGMPSPNYTSKDIGIKVKATPKINPNGTVMLEVEEEYSQTGGQQAMKTPNGSTYIDTMVDIPTTRKMESDVILENGQTVVFGGLTQTLTSNSESGIPILKDIPWIGKWLFGTVNQSEERTELLVFMTPYVLSDGEAAQAEALRRKRTMADTHPWEDHGWSLSNLADPVSKKEQMRRLKEEWKKQDEERKTKLEIEAEKLKRAKALEKMSKEERDFWLKQHKEELEKEAKEELEKKMLDDESQEGLRKLAEEVRERKLREADAEIKKADDAAKAENERTKHDAEKARKAPETKESKDAVEP